MLASSGWWGATPALACRARTEGPRRPPLPRWIPSLTPAPALASPARAPLERAHRCSRPEKVPKSLTQKMLLICMPIYIYLHVCLMSACAELFLGPWVVALFSLGAYAELQPPPPHPGTRVAAASWAEAGPALGEGVFLPP